MAGNLKALAHRRQSYTNERYCQALAGIRSITTKGALIPTTNLAQAQFEADVCGHIGYGTRPQDLSSGKSQPFGILSVIPREHELELSLGDGDSVVDFISKISPMLHEDWGGMTGVAGLRVRHSDRGAILCRLHAPGKIVLRGISEESWNSSLEESFGDSELFRSRYLGSLVALSDAERCHIEQEYSTVGEPHRDMRTTASLIISGILRRVHIFRARSRMHFTDLWFDFIRGRAAIHVEWAGDLSHSEVIFRLLDQRFGLPLKVDHKGCYCEPCTANAYSIQMRDSHRGDVSLYLKRSSMYDKHLPARNSGRCQFKLPGEPDTSGVRRGFRRVH